MVTNRASVSNMSTFAKYGHKLPALNIRVSLHYTSG
jgi:hypothetical protein